MGFLSPFVRGPNVHVGTSKSVEERGRYHLMRGGLSHAQRPPRQRLRASPQSGSYLSVPSSLMAIGLDIRRPAKEDFMSFSVLHGIGSEVFHGQLPVTSASQADVGAQER